MTFHIHSNPKLDAVTVHKFESCPLRVYNPEDRCEADQYFCCHPKRPRGVSYCPDGKIPETCPLIRAPIHIKLGKGIMDALTNDVGVDSSDDTNGDPTGGPTNV